MRITPILILCIMMITGCTSPSAGDKSEEAIFPQPALGDSSKLISSYFAGKSEGWFLYLNSASNQSKLQIVHSSDHGKTWDQSALPINQQWEQGIRKENVFASFHAKQEGISNSILLTSDPALGLMSKTLYQSSGNENNWTFVGDLSSVIDGYVTGITFRDNLTGWMGATQHGTAMLPLYRTMDGGKTWKLQEIPIPKDYKYGNAYPPHFEANQPLVGTLDIEFVGDSNRDTIEYQTTDGGENWTSKTPIAVAAPSPSVPPSTQHPKETVAADDKHLEERLIECGTVSFGKGDQETKLPLRCIKANYGIEYPTTPTISPKNPLEVSSYIFPSDLRDQLAGYWMSLYGNEEGVLILAPLGWRAASADVGANGSSAVRLENPRDPQQFVTYMDSGGCQGCAIANIGEFFPNLEDWAEQQGFSPDKTHKFNQRHLLSPNLMAYNLKPSAAKYETNGIAYQEHGGGGLFQVEEVHLKAASHALSTVILNLFSALHPASTDTP